MAGETFTALSEAHEGCEQRERPSQEPAATSESCDPKLPLDLVCFHPFHFRGFCLGRTLETLNFSLPLQSLVGARQPACESAYKRASVPTATTALPEPARPMGLGQREGRV